LIKEVGEKGGLGRGDVKRLEEITSGEVGRGVGTN